MYCPTCGQPIAQAESTETDSPLTETEEAQVADTETTEGASPEAEVTEGAPAAQTFTLEDVLAAHAAGYAAASANAGPKPKKAKKGGKTAAPAAQGYESDGTEAPAEGATTESTPEEGTDMSEGTKAPELYTTEQVQEIARKAAKKAAKEAAAAVLAEANSAKLSEAEAEKIRAEAYEAARQEAVQEYRTVGAGYRKGYVGAGSAANESAPSLPTDPREIAKMDNETFARLAESAFESDRFFGPLIREADRRAGRDS